MTAGAAIVLTGATGGLGQALVAEMARPGVVFFLSGRDPDRLEKVTELAHAQGAQVQCCDVSLTDQAAFLQALMQFEDAHPVDLVLCAAGVKTGNVDGCEPAAQVDRILGVNLTATVHVVQAILPKMIERRRGHIGLVSSLAAISPHADLLSYSATKAGVRAYGTALRQALHGTGVSVSVITPGYVDTPMTDRHKGPTPQKMSAETAASIIARGLKAKRAYITFPWLLTVLVRLKALLPVRLRDRIDQSHRARIIPDADEVHAQDSER